jgi:hypothetical protein
VVCCGLGKKKFKIQVIGSINNLNNINKNTTTINKLIKINNKNKIKKNQT